MVHDGGVEVVFKEIFFSIEVFFVFFIDFQNWILELLNVNQAEQLLISFQSIISKS